MANFFDENMIQFTVAALYENRIFLFQLNINTGTIAQRVKDPFFSIEPAPVTVLNGCIKSPTYFSGVLNFQLFSSWANFYSFSIFSLLFFSSCISLWLKLHFPHRYTLSGKTYVLARHEGKENLSYFKISLFLLSNSTNLLVNNTVFSSAFTFFPSFFCYRLAGLDQFCVFLGGKKLAAFVVKRWRKNGKRKVEKRVKKYR